MPKSSTPKKSTYFKNNYPVKKTVANVAIRKVNVISLYLPEPIMEKIVLLVQATQLSAAKIISLSSKPCPSCKDSPIEVTTKHGTFIIPRGIIYCKKTNSGVIITQKQPKKP